MSENRTLAKNSIILYTRLIITTFIGLYTSRVVLLELGVDNFGLYTIVGGLVAMFNMLSTTMVSTSTRYLAVETGKAANSDLNKVFNTLMIIHILFGVLLILIVEIIGLWYVRNYLNIAITQINDAVFVLQLSTLSAVLGTLIIPHQGLITANERFKIKAIIEILQSALNLGLVLLLTLSSDNKLRLYAVYVLLIQVVIVLIYFIYSKKQFPEIVKWKINSDKYDYKEISIFFGWQLIYVVGSVGSTHGGALIMNSFFGTVINAAYGVANRVNEFIFSFVKNLNQAAVPQIMKSYSSGNQNRYLELIYKLSKYTFFIMLIPAVPIVLSIDTLLLLWLKKVPAYTAIFVVLRIVHGLISCLQSGFDAGIEATRKIKNTKLFFSLVFLSLLPFVYLLYKFGYPPYIITIVYIMGELLFLVFQLNILKRLTEFRFGEYWRLTILPVFSVLILLIPQYFLRDFFGNDFIGFIIRSLISCSITLIIIFFVGLNSVERNTITLNVKSLYNSKIKYFSKYKTNSNF